MAAADGPRVPWQMTGHEELYALSVRYYLTDLAQRITHLAPGQTVIGTLMEDMRAVGLLLPETTTTREDPS